MDKRVSRKYLTIKSMILTSPSLVRADHIKWIRSDRGQPLEELILCDLFLLLAQEPRPKLKELEAKMDLGNRNEHSICNIVWMGRYAVRGQANERWDESPEG